VRISIGLVAILVTACTWNEADDEGYEYETNLGCNDEGTVDVRITPPVGPELTFEIERCRLDEAECEELCDEVLERIGIGYRVDICEVDFDDGKVYVHVQYDTFCDG
jgi:hypothetical protein